MYACDLKYSQNGHTLVDTGSLSQLNYLLLIKYNITFFNSAPNSENILCICSSN